MPITDLLERNAELYGDDVCLVELNPEIKENRRKTWKDFDLIESNPKEPYRREITWSVFDEKANRFANMLIGRGIKKGEKVGILMMNCLEWLPIYFGVLKTGAIAVLLRMRSFTAQSLPRSTYSYSDLSSWDVSRISPMNSCRRGFLYM